MSSAAAIHHQRHQHLHDDSISDNYNNNNNNQQHAPRHHTSNSGENDIRGNGNISATDPLLPLRPQSMHCSQLPPLPSMTVNGGTVSTGDITFDVTNDVGSGQSQQVGSVGEHYASQTDGCNNRLVASSTSSIKCICSCDEMDIKAGVHRRCSATGGTVCDRRVSRMMDSNNANHESDALNNAAVDRNNLQLPLVWTADGNIVNCDREERDCDKQQASAAPLLKRHRRCESATVTGYSGSGGGSQRKGSTKLGHRRTVSNITTTFSCQHRNSSFIVVMAKEADRPKDCMELIVDHCKVDLKFIYMVLLYSSDPQKHLT